MKLNLSKFSWAALALLAACSGHKENSEENPILVGGSSVRPACFVSQNGGAGHKVSCSAVQRTPEGDRPIENPSGYQFVWTNPPRLLSGSEIVSLGCHTEDNGLRFICEVSLATSISTLFRFELSTTAPDGQVSPSSEVVQLPWFAGSVGRPFMVPTLVRPGITSVVKGVVKARGAVGSLEVSDIGLQRLSVPLKDAVLGFSPQISSAMCHLDKTLYYISRTHLYAIEDGKLRVVAGSSSAVNIAGPLTDPSWVRFDVTPQLVCRKGTGPGDPDEVIVVGSDPGGLFDGEGSYPMFVARYPSRGKAVLQLPTGAGPVMGPASAVVAADGTLYLLDLRQPPVDGLGQLRYGAVCPRIVRIDPAGNAVNWVSFETNSEVCTAGGSNSRFGLALDASGAVLLSNPGGQIWRVTPDGTVRLASLFANSVSGPLDTVGFKGLSALLTMSDQSVLVAHDTPVDPKRIILSRISPQGLVTPILRASDNAVQWYTDGEVPAGGFYLPREQTVASIAASASGQEIYFGTSHSDFYRVTLADGVALSVRNLSYGSNHWVKNGDLIPNDPSQSAYYFGAFHHLVYEPNGDLLATETLANRLIRFHREAGGYRVKVLVGGGPGIEPGQVASPTQRPFGPLRGLALGADGRIFFIEGPRYEMSSVPSEESGSGSYLWSLSPDGFTLTLVAGTDKAGVYTRNVDINNSRTIVLNSVANNSVGSRGAGQVGSGGLSVVEGLSGQNLNFERPSALSIMSDGSLLVTEPLSGLLLRFAWSREKSKYLASVFLGRVEVESPEPPRDGTLIQDAAFLYPAETLALGDGSTLLSRLRGPQGGVFQIRTNGQIFRIAGGGLMRDPSFFGPAKQMKLHASKMVVEDDRTGRRSVLVLDGNERVVRLREYAPGSWTGETVLDRTQSSPSCGAGSVEGSSQSGAGESALRASFAQICTNNISSLAVRRTCGVPEGTVQMAFGIFFDHTIGSGMLLRGERKCEASD